MKIIRTDEAAFEGEFRRIRERGKTFDPELWQAVGKIVDAVATRGDAALFEYTARWDGHAVTAATVEATAEERRTAAAQVAPEDLAILSLAAERISRFHERQRQEGWSVGDEEGVSLGQRLLPLEKVGIYAPGGTACYPSTVLMTAIPARIAGVGEIVLVSPTKDGKLSPFIAAAAELSGVTRIFKIGGAQAVAALAYGTASVPQVDKIVGPGNAYVAMAKKMVFGQVAIDMIAGPSEVLIIADGLGEPAFAAADLLAQAEHDALASALLLTPDEGFARAVAREVDRQLATLSRRDIAARSLESYGAAIVTASLAEAVALANRFAPEHLEVMVQEPRTLLPELKNAGAIFLGSYTPEALGDYMAGPNHVLPTGGTARFASPLGVYDFCKRTSVLEFSREALERYGRQTGRFASLEGLEAHGRSALLRLAAKKA
ncbi:MAG: histidinol dehydrogenase [Deltaproteobacteria bacterium]|nr:histidinol dehydrogenase [Deltaproteobacteria bacterium]